MKTQSKAFNDTVRVDRYKFISSGSTVATDEGMRLTSAYTKAIDELPKDQ